MRKASSPSSPETGPAARRRSPADYGLLLEAAGWLAAARLAVLLVPFRILSRRLGTHMAESPADDDPRSETLRRVGWALHAVSRRAPWRSLCLEQGLAGKMMLRRRDLPNTLYLGVARDTAAQVRAHAWLRSGRLYVSGAEGRERFTVVSTFADGVRER